MECKKKNMSAISGVVVSRKQQTFDWCLKGFCAYPKPTVHSSQGLTVRYSKASETINSPCFTVNEGELILSNWKLILCPCKIVDDEEYVGIYLQKISGHGVSHVQLKIYLLIENGEKLNMREGDYTFAKLTFFGWDNFILRKLLTDDKTFLHLNGTLCICCEMVLNENVQIDGGQVELSSQSNSAPYRDILKPESVKMLSKHNSLFKDLYDSKICSDVILEVENETFNVHKAILSAYSPVFARMFEHVNMKENCQNSVKIVDMTSCVAEQMIQYIYWGKFTESPKILLGLYACADKYNIYGLMGRCSSVMISKLDEEFVCEAAINAYLHNDIALLGAAKKFIVLQPLKIMATESWTKLLNEYPNLAKDIIDFNAEPVLKLKTDGSFNIEKFEVKPTQEKAAPFNFPFSAASPPTQFSFNGPANIQKK